MQRVTPRLRELPKQVVDTLEATIDEIMPSHECQVIENIQMVDNPQAQIDAVEDKYIVVTATLNDNPNDSSGQWVFDNYDIEEMLVKSGFMPISHFELYFYELECAYQVWCGRLV